MRGASLSLLSLFVVALATRSSSSTRPISLFIGTGGEGYGCAGLVPGAQAPHGAMRVSPDTTGFDGIAWQFCHTGGYAYADTHITAFSHVRMVGAGVVDLGNLGILPILAPFSSVCATSKSCAQPFTHEDEVARPGYYAVTMEQGLRAELTAAPFSAVHRYTAPSEEAPLLTVRIDLAHSLIEGTVKSSQVAYDRAANQVTGSILQKGEFSGRNGVGVWIYFVVQLDRAPSRFATFSNGTVQWNATSLSGVNTGFAAEFDTTGAAGPTVELSVGLSFVSVANAKLNLALEANYSAAQAWERAVFSRVTVNDPSPDQVALTKFNTALYHAFTPPTRYSETAGGLYTGLDGQVHAAEPGRQYYSDLSIWDIHRTQAPLMALLAPSVYADVLQSLVTMYEQGGAIPRWPFMSVYTGCMVGNHANAMFSSGLLMGHLAGVDWKTAYAGMRAVSTGPVPHVGRKNIEAYLKQGYVAVEDDSKSAVLTLAYSFDDFCLSLAAGALGQAEDQQLFYERSNWYANTWSPKDKFFCPRDRAGAFRCPEGLDRLNVFSNSYVEGDAWHYRFHGQQGNASGIISLFGGPKAFVQELTTFMEESKAFDNLLPDPYFWAGNEEDLLAPWLFAFAGRRDLTVKYVKDTVSRRYTVLPDGIPGNDDYGEMSSWLFFSMLGFYPMTGTADYIWSEPTFNNVTIWLDDGKTRLDVLKTGTTGTLKINGAPVTGPTFNYAQIKSGGVMEFA
jgi:predicted alpha-1,2-mannosidase